MFGQPPQLRRNAVNLQLIVDPISPAGLQLAGSAIQMYMQGICARIGVLFTSDLDVAVTEASKLGDLSLQGQFARYATWALSIRQAPLL